MTVDPCLSGRQASTSLRFARDDSFGRFFLITFTILCNLLFVNPALAARGDKQDFLREADRAYGQGSIDKSVDLYQKALEADPKNAAAAQSLGVTYAEKGEWDKAIDNLKKAQALNPNNAEIYVNLSLAYAEKKDFETAVNYAQKAVNVDPKKANAHLTLGLAYEGLGNTQKAIDAYQRGIAVDPKNTDLYLSLGNL